MEFSNTKSIPVKLTPDRKALPKLDYSKLQASLKKKATGEADQDYNHEFFDEIVEHLKDAGFSATHREFDKYQGVYITVSGVDKFWIKHSDTSTVEGNLVERIVFSPEKDEDEFLSVWNYGDEVGGVDADELVEYCKKVGQDPDVIDLSDVSSSLNKKAGTQYATDVDIPGDMITVDITGKVTDLKDLYIRKLHSTDYRDVGMNDVDGERCFKITAMSLDIDKGDIDNIFGSWANDPDVISFEDVSGIVGDEGGSEGTSRLYKADVYIHDFGRFNDFIDSPTFDLNGEAQIQGDETGEYAFVGVNITVSLTEEGGYWWQDMKNVDDWYPNESEINEMREANQYGEDVSDEEITQWMIEGNYEMMVEEYTYREKKPNEQIR